MSKVIAHKIGCQTVVLLHHSHDKYYTKPCSFIQVGIEAGVERVTVQVDAMRYLLRVAEIIKSHRVKHVMRTISRSFSDEEVTVEIHANAKAIMIERFYWSSFSESPEQTFFASILFREIDALTAFVSEVIADYEQWVLTAKTAKTDVDDIPF